MSLNKNQSPQTNYCFTAYWPAASRIRCFVSCRLGGLNHQQALTNHLGLRAKHQAPEFNINHQRFIHQFQDIRHAQWLNQVHGSDVFEVAQMSHVNKAHNQFPSADAVYISEQASAGVVLTADCLSIVVTNQQQNKLLVIHGGWRSLLQGIIDNALKYFEPHESLMAWLGPSINPFQYEVGKDVYDGFVQSESTLKSCFYPVFTQKDKWFFDLKSAANHYLIVSNRNITISEGFRENHHKNVFFSHRLANDIGRMATIAWIT